MSDQTAATAFAGEGQPQEAPVTPAPNAAQPEVLTREEAQRMAKEAAEDAFRRAQSLFDKNNAKVIKKVQDDMAALVKSLELQRKAGIQISPEQESQLKQQVFQNAFADPEPAAPPEEADEEAPLTLPDGRQVPPEVVAINREAVKMQQEAGFNIEQTDPEFALLNRNAPSGYLYLKSVEAAIAAKKERLAKVEAPAPPTQPQPNLHTPLPVAGSPASPTSGMSGMEKIEYYNRTKKR